MEKEKGGVNVRKFWTEEEDSYLVRYYQDKDNKTIARDLGRTEESIKNRARTLGVKKTSHRWTEEEDDILVKFYGKLGATGLSGIKLNRTLGAIHKRAEKLGLACDLFKQRVELGLISGEYGRGMYKDSNGYLVYSETGKTEDRVYMHRKVMEDYLGRKLTSEEVVHHKDGNKTNNCVTNLEVMSRSEHTRLHLKDSLHKI